MIWQGLMRVIQLEISETMMWRDWEAWAGRNSICSFHFMLKPGVHLVDLMKFKRQITTNIDKLLKFSDTIPHKFRSLTQYRSICICNEELQFRSDFSSITMLWHRRFEHRPTVAGAKTFTRGSSSFKTRHRTSLLLKVRSKHQDMNPF